MSRWLFTCALLAGCAVGPDYHRPPLDVPAHYRDAAPAAAGVAGDAASFGDSGWWEVYSDPDLQALLATAIKNNYDVKIAVARIEEARAQLGSQRLNYLPQLSVDSSAGRAKTSEYATLPGFARTYNEAQVQILASYQIDLWGQLRRATEAARANLLASQYAKRAVAVTLVASVASAYFDLISLDSQLEITRHTVVDREKFLELTHAQHERGYATGLDVATAEADLAAARATVPDLERRIAQTEDEISVLIGRNPGPVTRAHYGEAVPEAPPRPPPGLPSRLLERRPDVAQAEQQLVAANAQIGVAKAALFPNISLTGSAGSLSVPFNNLFSAPAAEWSAGVSLIQPLAERTVEPLPGRARRREQARGAVPVPEDGANRLSGCRRCAGRLHEVRRAGARAGAPGRRAAARARDRAGAIPDRLCVLFRCDSSRSRPVRGAAGACSGVRGQPERAGAALFGAGRRVAGAAGRTGAGGTMTANHRS